jgi:hypothetical protein
MSPERAASRRPATKRADQGSPTRAPSPSPHRLAEELTFYDYLISELDQQRDSVDIYSISACFGFYSQGMSVFSSVLSKMRNALLRPGAFRTKNMRLLLITDDNPIDSFGVDRFHNFVEPAGLKIKRLPQPDRQEDWVQFAVFDGRRAILTHPQNGFWDDALDVGINALAPTELIDASSRVKELSQRFSSSWEVARPFDFPRIPTLSSLELLVRQAFPVASTPAMMEEDYKSQLFTLLHGVCDRGLIHREFRWGDDVLDFVVGDPNIRLHTGHRGEAGHQR